MDVENIKIIISCDFPYAVEPLRKFIEKNSSLTAFPELNKNGMRQDLWNTLFSHIENGEAKDIHCLCLSAIRILSRDKTYLNDVIKNKWVDLLQEKAYLSPKLIILNENVPYDIIIESLKCICNLIFNSEVARTLIIKNGTVEGIIIRLRTFREPELPYDVKFFDMRLLFLLTALCDDIRPKIKEELHGLTYLIETLDLVTKDEHHNEELNENVISNKQCDLASEILKTLFNLTIRSNSASSADEEEESHFIRLALVLHDLLMKHAESQEKRHELQNHIVNLLTNLPNGCLKELISIVHDEIDLSKDLEYEGHNMSAIHELLQFLKIRFEKVSDAVGHLELLSPILNVLLNCAMSNKILRKYLRHQILPPLREVHTRPEQGNTLRNQLCRLLTTPSTQVRDLAAELLFVLCKENVSRMIKYTGYGNAAGLFANRGLMGRSQNVDPSYSSDSENSDTEEFQQYKHGINPVLGCYEAPHPNPTEGMSEEQKEYEAMKLVNLIDSLAKQGIVQPCRIGEDGRPEPVEHVLQLQDELPRQQVHQNEDSN